MKKHLIAAAVVSAFAAPAMAQNVQVYGNVEAGYLFNDTDNASSTTNVVGRDVVNSSRLGFRGTEDLGGGLKAFFRLESSLDASDGGLGSGNGTAGGANFFDRGAEVGLSGAFGAVKVGKFDMTGTEGIDSAVSQFGNVGNFSGVDIGSDRDGSIQYQTPTIAGWYAQVAHSSSDNSGVNRTNSLFVDGKLAGITVKLGYSEESITSVEQKQKVVGLAYDFGMLQAGLAYTKNDKGTAADQTQTNLTAKIPLANGLAVHGAYLVRETTGSADTKISALGLSKGLSKRTTGYLAVRSTDNPQGTNDSTEYYIAVNHAF